MRGLPGGSVVKIPPADGRRHRSRPWAGKNPTSCEPQLLSLCSGAASSEPTCGARGAAGPRGNRRSTRSPHRSYGGASCSPATRGRPTRQPRPNAAKTKQIKLLKKKNTFWGRSLVNLPLTKHRGQQERQQRGGTRMDPWRPRGWVPVKKKEKSHDK